MSSMIIEGGRPLKGQIEINGMKNAALPIICAALLVPEPVVLQNVPKILDVVNLLKVVEGLGVKVKWLGPHEVQLDAVCVEPTKLNQALVRRMRASIMLLASFFGRGLEASIAQPGGDMIGARPLDAHFYALRALGAEVTEKNLIYTVFGKPRGTRLMIPEVSVMATEMAMIAAVLAPGSTKIRTAAMEPHVQDLAAFLNTCGAKVSGAGGSVIKIEGVKKLHGATHRIIPDQLEVGTLAAMAAATRSELDILGVEPDHLDMILYKLGEAGVDYKVAGTTLKIRPSKLHAFKLRTLIYPGFPTDLQGPFAVLATQCHGVSLIHDSIYEDRFGYVKNLIKMAANITICDPHRIIVTGPTALRGAEVPALDIRAGATCVIAGLLAEGRTTIGDVDHIDRGYERLVERLTTVGARISRS